jgi:HPt (histidine-containing phosphotransfer) domain-containing protein
MELDAARLSELRVFTPDELREISADSIRAIDELLAELEQTLAGGQLAAVAEAAHRARNEALLVGARELCDAFVELEHSARREGGARARQAVDRARTVWPQTRAAIAALGAQDTTD